MSGPLILGDVTVSKRFFLGTARYPSLDQLTESIDRSGAEVVTVSLRRESANGGKNPFWSQLRSRSLHFLPNTAGCRTAKEAVLVAHLARELFDTRWIKVEVTCDDLTLAPDPFETLEAARILTEEGYLVFPYMTADLALADRLLSLGGSPILMPWGSPIGSGRGISDPQSLRAMRSRFPQAVLVVDAGIGAPSDAAKAMELGFDAVLLNTAVALADDPPTMAHAFSLAIEAGRSAYHAGLMPQRDFATPSTPTTDRPFWQQAEEK